MLKTTQKSNNAWPLCHGKSLFLQPGAALNLKSVCCFKTQSFVTNLISAA